MHGNSVIKHVNKLPSIQIHLGCHFYFDPLMQMHRLLFDAPTLLCLLLTQHLSVVFTKFHPTYFWIATFTSAHLNFNRTYTLVKHLLTLPIRERNRQIELTFCISMN